MKYAVTGTLMKQMDQRTIVDIGVPSMVLMERAALSVVSHVEKRARKQDRILVVCGSGNNGADGFAIARLLFMKKYQVTACFVGNIDHMTKECEQQMQIAKKLGLSIRRDIDFSEYNIMIDCIFGIGLSRMVEGQYESMIQKINECYDHTFIISVDLPSGIDANTGQILNVAVKANLTITFQKMKLGLLLYPGASYAGEVIVEDVGIVTVPEKDNKESYIYYEPKDISELFPRRQAYSNKGTYGKVLVIAGSDSVTGAAYFSAYAAYRMGTGLVKILSSKKAVASLRMMLPEALYACYDDEEDQDVIESSITWADSIVIGPGLGTSKKAADLLDRVIHNVKETNQPIVIDADALNLISQKMNNLYIKKEDRFNYIMDYMPKKSVLTPHLLELSRLSLEGIHKIPSILIDIVQRCTYNGELIYVLKDARTIVASKNLRYINMSGNDGMATGGSGDVLSGMIAALLALGQLKEKAATLGVYLHGLAGDYARKKKGASSMLARDIIEALPEVLMTYEGRSI